MKRHGRLRPLTPIFDPDIRRGGISVGNTPATPVPIPVVPIGLKHQTDPDGHLFQSRGICVANGVLVVSAYFASRVTTLSLGTSPSILGSVYDATDLQNGRCIARIDDDYVLVGVVNGLGPHVTSVDISTPASPSVADTVASDGYLRQLVVPGPIALGFADGGGGGWYFTGTDVSDPTSLSDLGSNSGAEAFTRFAFDGANDVLFFGEGGGPANLVTYQSSVEVDSESLGGGGTVIEVVHDPTTMVVAAVWIDGSDNTHITTFTYDSSGNLTAGGTVSSGDGAGVGQAGCAVLIGTDVHAFVAVGTFSACKHYRFDISTPGSPTCSILSDVNGPTYVCSAPWQAIHHNGIIYVTDWGDLI